MELLDVYDNEGKKTGRIVERDTYKENLSKDEHIGVAQIFIENDKGDFLIEESAKTTGFKYLPVSGHIISGETPKEAIIREAKEEIGLDISNEDVKDVGSFIIDRPVRFIFYLKKDIDLTTLKLQPEEVENVSYKSATEMMYLIEKGLMHPVHRDIVPKVLKLK